MALLELRDTNLDSVQRGQGDAVVLVHGSAGDRRSWDAPMAGLAEHFRVVAYSRRYHWPNQSIASGADYSFQQHVDDLGAIVERLELAPANVVGHSYGALVALHLAMQRPQLVRSLVLGEPPALTLFTSDPPRPSEMLALLCHRPGTAFDVFRLGATGIEPAKSAIRRADRDEALRRFGTAVLGRERFESLGPDRLSQARANLIDAELTGSGFPPLAAERVRLIAVPVLLVTGEKSRRVFHRFVDRLRELLPQARHVEIPGACHLLHEDKPAAYVDAVVSFLLAAHG